MIRRNRSSENDRILLIQSLRSGYFHEWLNILDKHIQQVKSNRALLTSTLDTKLYEALDSIGRIRRMIAEIVFA
jgi:hypothetical protein